MDDMTELTIEVAKEGVKQFFAPVQEVIRQIVGPSANEIGLMWGDVFRVRRLKNSLRLFEEVKRLAAEHGLRLNPVAPRLLLPILEAASLEEDDDMHKRWSMLLTNAATDSDSEVLPAFPDMLKQLTPREAQFLDAAYDEVIASERSEVASRPPEHRLEPPQPVRIGRKLDFRMPKTMVMIQNLERMMLVTRNSVPITQEDQVNTFSADNHLYLTSLGKALIIACRMPGL